MSLSHHTSIFNPFTTTTSDVGSRDEPHMSATLLKHHDSTPPQNTGTAAIDSREGIFPDHHNLKVRRGISTSYQELGSSSSSSRNYLHDVNRSSQEVSSLIQTPDNNASILDVSLEFRLETNSQHHQQ